ncbi:hypothetical protein RsS62_28150 [Rhizobium dioscoreae]|nr:hypothetical protein RsS62_28150 [Rhizobium dioscoreae]
MLAGGQQRRVRSAPKHASFDGEKWFELSSNFERTLNTAVSGPKYQSASCREIGMWSDLVAMLGIY